MTVSFKIHYFVGIPIAFVVIDTLPMIAIDVVMIVASPYPDHHKRP
jgi:hypothetical protein